MMKNKKILITGINGFIGGSLKNYIKERYPYLNVFGIDKKGKKTNDFLKLDINDRSKLKTIISKVRPICIFHFAGDTANRDFKRLSYGNIFSTFVLLDVVKDIKGYSPRIIIPSSAAEYGRSDPLDMPIEESHPLNPVSLYGFSKMVQTELSLFFAAKGLNISIARMFNVIGKGTPVNLSVGKFAHELALINKKKKDSIIHTKNLNTRRDFLDIQDVCHYLLAIGFYGKRGEIYNICRGRSYRIGFLLDQLVKISGLKKIKVIEDRKSDRENEIADSFGSIKKLKKLDKLIPPVPIIKSLRETYFYYFSKI